METTNQKMRHWNELSRVPSDALKPFSRAGGFKGTAIKPMWTIKRMTEVFGPCGDGWGMNEPTFNVVPADKETMVYCTVGVWVQDGQKRSELVYGVGGDKVLAIRSTGPFIDDEAFKKAYTDALTNALKHIGAGADVHMGLWDGNKYADNDSAAPAKSSASLKRDGEWEKLKAELDNDFADCHSTVSLAKLRADYREKARERKWPAAWLSALANEFDTMEATLSKGESLMAGE